MGVFPAKQVFPQRKSNRLPKRPSNLVRVCLSAPWYDPVLNPPSPIFQGPVCRLGTLLAVICLPVSGSLVAAPEKAVANKKVPVPFHQRIDQTVAAGNIVPVVRQAGDAEFVRRIYLDLTGSIPTVEEVRHFLADADADKRSKLVDTLLDSRAFTRHMATTFDVWFMERRAAKHVKDPEFRNYLIESFAKNKPYDQLVHEILAADGTEQKIRPAARFYLDRDGEPNLLTRDVGRIFFGRDLQCAQCHDHPNITDYLQREYYGIYAFFNRTYLFQPDKKKPALLAEKAEGEATYKSVFTEVAASSLPQLPKSKDKVVVDPKFKPGEEWKVKPNKKDKKVQAVPKYSRRQQIAKLVVDGKSDTFNRNIANRLWAHMMGQGLVEPFDFHHAANPPSNPALMTLLAEGIVNLDYDVKSFLREIALSDSYQRSFEMSSTLVAEAEKVRSTLAVLQAKEKKSNTVMMAGAKGFEDARKIWEEQKIDLDKKESELNKTSKKRDDALVAIKKSEAVVNGAVTKLKQPQQLLIVLDEAAAKNAEALKLLPKDKEFAAASAVVKKKADKVRAEVTKLNAVKVAKEKALAALRVTQKKAVADAVKLQKEFDTNLNRVAQLKQTLDTALFTYESHKSAWKHAQQVLGDASELVSYADVMKEIKVVRKKAANLKAGLAVAQSDSDNKNKLTADLARAVSGVEEASAQLKGDAELVSMLSSLKEKQSLAKSKSDAAMKVFKAKGIAFVSADKLANESGEKRDAVYISLTERLTRTSAVGAFKALTPEQLCQSIVTASGEKERSVALGNTDFDNKMVAQAAARKKSAEAKAKAAEEAKAKVKVEVVAGAKKEKTVTKKKIVKKKAVKKKAPEKQWVEADRQQYVEEYVDRRLNGATKKFIQLFGGQAGEAQGGFFATADQALFLANDGQVRGWLNPTAGNLTDRLGKIEKPDELVREIYLSVLNREPEAKEVEELKAYLAARADQKSKAIQELAWSLMSSVEFRFKH